MNLYLIIISAVLGLSICLSLLQLLIARKMSVKMIVLDVLTTVITGLLVLAAFIFQQEFLLDIALVYGILAFASVLLVGRYLEKGV